IHFNNSIFLFPNQRYFCANGVFPVQSHHHHIHANTADNWHSFPIYKDFQALYFTNPSIPIVDWNGSDPFLFFRCKCCAVAYRVAWINLLGMNQLAMKRRSEERRVGKESRGVWEQVE